MSIPNLISGLRLLLAPVLLWLAGSGQSVAFLTGMGIALFSDWADGWLARRWNQMSAFGTRLDSWADFATYMVLALGSWWLWPGLIRDEGPTVLVIFSSYTITKVVGLLRYRQLDGFHTWSGKLSAVALAVGGLSLLAGFSPWPLRVAAGVVVLSDLEELALMALLPRWEADLPSLWHALQRNPGAR
jgi:cardiolipin synthase